MFAAKYMHTYVCVHIYVYKTQQFLDQALTAM